MSMVYAVCLGTHTSEEHTPVKQLDLLHNATPLYPNAHNNARRHCVRNNNQILQGVQTRCKEKFYRVDREC